MVDNRTGQERILIWAGGRLRRSFWAALVATVGGAALVMAAGQTGMTTSADASPSTTSAIAAGHVSLPVTAPVASSASASAVTPPQTSVTAVTAPPAPAETLAPQPSAATLVAQVEAAGIVPGPTWSWSMGDTATPCGVTSSAGVAAGCTSWSTGAEHTMFAGSPTLALVAHEVANAETEQFALPALLQEVSTAAAGSSWSPTDAVASCLVVHFLSFQDDAAGSWQCPAGLAMSVATHIHDTIVTTQTTAVCGISSGASSTLTFTASAGSLTVTSPSGGSTPQTATAGTSVTVSGVGTFAAKDLGGTAIVSGVCKG